MTIHWYVGIIVFIVLILTHAYAWKRGRNRGHELGYRDAKEVLVSHISRIPELIEKSIETDRKHGKGKFF